MMAFNRRLCLLVAAVLALSSTATASQFHGDYNYTWHRTVTVYSLGNGVFFANEVQRKGNRAFEEGKKCFGDERRGMKGGG